MRVGIIGAGRMGEALATGLIRGKAVSPKQIILSDPKKERLTELARKLGISVTASNNEASNSSLVILAVKPGYVEQVANEIRAKVKNKLVVSIAAGIRIKKIESILDKSRVIRVMPNTPCSVCEGAIAYSLGRKVAKADEERFLTVFSKVGKCMKVMERHMDSVTGLTGSGPAYIYFIASALMEAGKKQGLSERAAEVLVLQLLAGATKMIRETKKTPEELIAMVTSPKGTTIEGLKVLEKRKVRDAFVRAIAAATKRAKELASGN